MVIVDTDYSVIFMSFDLVCNISGRFKDENNPVLLEHAICLHLNKDKKITKLNTCWDNNDPTLQSVVTKVVKRVEEANKAAGIGTTCVAGGVVAGQ